MLNYSSGDYIVDALQMGFEVASLAINSIPYHDKITQKTIYLGLKAIKGVPRDFSYWIIENRPFSSIEDFVTRLPKNYKKLSLLSPLVELGLFDDFDKNRQKILVNLPNLFVFVEELGGLFADANYSWTEADDFTEAEKFYKEQELIGVGISAHPIQTLAKQALYPTTPIATLTEGSQATLLVEVQKLKVIRTKKGENMAFLQVHDSKSRMDVTVFSDQYRKFASILSEGKFYYINGKIQSRDGRLQMIAQDLKEAVAERFWIQVKNHEYDKEISSILEQYKGPIPVIIRYEEEQKTIVSTQYFVRKDSTLQEKLKEITMKTIYR